MMRQTSILLFALAIGAPAWAQEPGVDKDECRGQDSPLHSRLPGCGLYQCMKKEFDSADLVINKAGEAQALEGAIEQVTDACPASSSQLQLQRNVEAALRKAGYTVVYSGKHEGSNFPLVTVRKGNQWISVQTSDIRPTS